MKTTLSVIAMGVLLCIPRIAAGWEAQGKSSYQGRVATYKSATATRGKQTDRGFHLLSVYLYPWTFDDDEKKEMERMRRTVPRKDWPAYLDKNGLTKQDHAMTVNFKLKDGETDFGPENIEAFHVVMWDFDLHNSSLSWYNDEARRRDGVTLQHFHVDTLARGGTVTFELRFDHAGTTGDLDVRMKAAVRANARVVSSTVDGNDVAPKAPNSGGATVDGPGKALLAELEIRAQPNVIIEDLKPGAPRMSGKVHSNIESVGDELVGAQFVRVPWKSTPKYSIKVTKGGYLYALKGGKDLLARNDLEWEARPEAVSGPYLPSAHRIAVRAGETLSLEGWELSLVAAKISTK